LAASGILRLSRQAFREHVEVPGFPSGPSDAAELLREPLGPFGREQVSEGIDRSESPPRGDSEPMDAFDVTRVAASSHGQFAPHRVEPFAERPGRNEPCGALAIFDHEIVDGLMRHYSGAAGDNLYQSSHPLAACIKIEAHDRASGTLR
jgi:hypothetical protein